MIDKSCCFCINSRKKRLILHVKTLSRYQALYFQSVYGGEIHRRNRFQYTLRFRAYDTLHILSDLAPYIRIQREMIVKGFALYSSSLPPTSDDLSMCHYLGGAFDAVNSFQCRVYATKTQRFFSFTIQSESECALMPSSKRSICNNYKVMGQSAIAYLERFQPFILEYTKYRAALYDSLIEPFDESILSSKDAAYYRALNETTRLSNLQKRAESREKKSAEKARLVAEKIARKQAAKAERLAKIAAERALRLTKREHGAWMKFEIVPFVDAANHYDEVYRLFHRTHKTCRLCKQTLPIEAFDRTPLLADRHKYECKKCAYDRYVKPRLHVFRVRVKEWNRANPDKARAIRRKSNKRPQAKVRRMLRNTLKRFLIRKTEYSSSLFGCNAAQFVAHIESLWQPGMNWDNYGLRPSGWELDHIIPCAAFDLSKIEERRKCCHYSNMQPLWGHQNWSKADSLPDGRKARQLQMKMAA